MNDAPDLILIPKDGYAFGIKVDLSERDLCEQIDVKSKVNAIHRHNGMCVFYGKDFKKGFNVKEMKIIDVLPHILYLLNFQLL